MTAPTSPTSGLEALLAGEHAAVNGYGTAGAVLVRANAPAALVGAARAGLDAHRVSRDRLTAAIVAAGGIPPPALAAYALPFPLPDAAAAMRLLIGIEDRLCRVAGYAVSASAGNQRLPAVDVLSAAAVRAARLRLLTGSPVSKAVTPFPGR